MTKPLLTRRQFLKTAATGLLSTAALCSHHKLLNLCGAITEEPKSLVQPNLELIESLLQRALSNGGEFGEFFLQQKAELVLQLDNGIVTTMNARILEGASMRITAGSKSVFTAMDRLDVPSLEILAANAARRPLANAISKAHTRSKMQVTHPGPQAHFLSLPEIKTRLESIAMIELFARIVNMSNSKLEHISNVLIESSDLRLIVNTRKVAVQFVTPFLYFRTQMTSVSGTKHGVIVNETGGRYPFESYQFQPEELGDLLAKKAETLLAAQDLTEGSRTVVFDGACAELYHALIAEELLKERTPSYQPWFRETDSRTVGPHFFSVFDDPAAFRTTPVENFDDVGSPSSQTTLVRLGNVAKPSQSVAPYYRESYGHPPVPCYLNTVIPRGISSRADILSGISKGIYVAKVGAPITRVSDTYYLVPLTEAYSIEQGAIGGMLKPVVVALDAGRLLRSLQAIGDDATAKSSFRYSQGQRLPCCTSAPTTVFDQVNLLPVRINNA